MNWKHKNKKKSLYKVNVISNNFCYKLKKLVTDFIIYCQYLYDLIDIIYCQYLCDLIDCV